MRGAMGDYNEKCAVFATVLQALSDKYPPVNEDRKKTGSQSPEYWREEAIKIATSLPETAIAFIGYTGIPQGEIEAACVLIFGTLKPNGDWT